MTAKRRQTILVAVCHPDDEVIWIGGLVAALSRYPFLRVLVICLSGNDPGSPRLAEFASAGVLAGYERGIVLGGPLRGANDPLPPLGAVLEEGLRRLGVAASDLDLLITHPAHGDEHTHPHHRQAYRELRQWSVRRDVPFAFFCHMPLPNLLHRPLLTAMRRDEGLHVVNLAACTPAPTRAGVEPCPARYYLQVSVDPRLKRRLIDCYVSIDIAAHTAGYAAITANVEGLYLCDWRGFAIVERVLDAMPPPSVADALADPAVRLAARDSLLVTIKSALKRLLLAR